MKIIDTTLPGVLLFEPKIFPDGRGFLLETFRDEVAREAGIQETFVQDNHSRSTKGVLRGLHYQSEKPQGKLVRVVRGSVFDVAVDVRPKSSTFGEWFGATLDDTSMRMMFVPAGFAHGFMVLSEVADFVYKCTDYYDPQSEQGVLWNDPEIGIVWPEIDISLSEKDEANPRLRDQKNLPILKVS